MTSFDSIILGDESLTKYCAERLLSRGHNLTVLVTGNPDLKAWAESKHIRVEPHGRDLAQRLSDVSVDWLFSIANLNLLPQTVLGLARKGAINFHDGPLPRRAGLNAPVWAMIEGETEHAVTWHLIDEGVDTGDILVQRKLGIAPDDTALTLNTKCYEAGLTSFEDVLNEITNGLPNRHVQDPDQRSYHALADRPEANGLIRMDRPADETLRLIRALDHGTYWNPLCTPKIKIGDAYFHISTAEKTASKAAPGTVIDVDKENLTVAVKDAALRLTGLKDMYGKAIAPVDLVALGDVMPSVSDAERKAMTETLRTVAAKDSFWRNKLVDAAPLDFPFLSRDTGTIETGMTGIDAEHLCSALAVLSGRLSPRPDTVLAFANPAMIAAASTGLVNPWVPVTLGDLLHDRPDPQQGFARDLFLRDARLAPLDTPALGVSLAAGCIPDTAITFERRNDTVMAHVDTGRVSSDYAQVLIRRLRWIADQLSDCKQASQVDFIPPGERRDVLEAFNASACDVSGPETMHAAFEAQVARTPDAIALVHEHAHITFADLNAKANRIAHTLRDRGVGPDTMIGLHCHRGPNLVAAALGILKAGGAYVPLDPDYPQDRLAHYLGDSGAPVVITESALEDTLPATQAARLVIDRDVNLSASDSNPTSQANGTNLAYVIYTSGSTGVPKGVMVEHRNVMNFYAGMDAVVPDQEGATWLAVTSLSFDISVLELFYTMARGIKVVLPSTSQRGVISGGTRRQSSGGMDFSIYYWGNDDGVGRDKYRLLLEGAKFADENGFCAVWTPERHFHAFGGPYPNPSVTGAAVAGVTRQIGVRAGSCVAPLHHPARIAEEWAVIDNLTNGRAGLAIASGWQPDDFVLRPENTPPDNKPAMFDAIEQVRKLWRGDPVAFPRKNGEMHEVVTQPRPVSKELPIWVTTAGNPETWREAGRNGANVLTHLLGQSIDEVAEKIGIYRSALRDAGYNPDAFTVTLMLHTCLAETRDTARDIAREPMKDYLRSAAGLIKQYAWAFPAFKKPKGVNNAFELNLGDLSEEDLEGILDFAFERYFNDSGLFGTVDDALARVEQLKAIGVSEIACLIDYGIAADQVLEGLKPLAEVVRRSEPKTDHIDGDFSIAAMLKRHNVTHMQCTPSMARMIAMDDDARPQLQGLQHLFLGGEALPGPLVNDLRNATNATIHNMYGPTETTIWSSTEVASCDEATVNIGRPIANTKLYVLDDALNPVGIGEAGELWIGGKGVTRGYWQRDDLTSDRYRANPFGAGRMYRTGDLVQWRPDGRLNFLGRADHQVKLRGFRIELGEIESVLQKVSGVTNAVVMAREDTPGDVRLVAYLTATHDMAANALRAQLAQHLPDYMVPAHFVTLDGFPVTPNKKIDRNALPAPGLSEARTQPVRKVDEAGSGKASDALRTQIGDIWSEMLGVEGIGPDDNFFELGGHSLLAVQTHRSLRDRLGVGKLAITDIFQFPTLGALADRVAKLGADASAAKGAGSANVMPLKPAKVVDRAQMRSDAMARRRAMRARRQA